MQLLYSSATPILEFASLSLLLLDDNDDSNEDYDNQHQHYPHSSHNHPQSGQTNYNSTILHKKSNLGGESLVVASPLSTVTYDHVQTALSELHRFLQDLQTDSFNSYNNTQQQLSRETAELLTETPQIYKTASLHGMSLCYWVIPDASLKALPLLMGAQDPGAAIVLSVGISGTSLASANATIRAIGAKCQDFMELLLVHPFDPAQHHPEDAADDFQFCVKALLSTLLLTDEHERVSSKQMAREPVPQSHMTALKLEKQSAILSVNDQEAKFARYAKTGKERMSLLDTYYAQSINTSTTPPRKRRADADMRDFFPPDGGISNSSGDHYYPHHQISSSPPISAITSSHRSRMPHRRSNESHQTTSTTISGSATASAGIPGTGTATTEASTAASSSSVSPIASKPPKTRHSRRTSTENNEHFPNLDDSFTSGLQSRDSSVGSHTPQSYTRPVLSPSITAQPTRRVPDFPDAYLEPDTPTTTTITTTTLPYEHPHGRSSEDEPPNVVGLAPPPPLQVYLALNEDLRISYRHKSLDYCKIEGSIQARIKNSPHVNTDLPTNFTLQLRDPSGQVERLSQIKRFVVGGASNDSRELQISIPAGNLKEYVPLFKYKCNQSLLPIPLRAQVMVKLRDNHCRVAIQLSANPDNDEDLRKVSVMLKVPDEIDGTTLVSNDGGQYTASNKAVAWSIPKLGRRSSQTNIKLMAVFDWNPDNNPQAAGPVQMPKFPIYVHCKCRDEQLSDVYLEVPGARVKMDRRFRLFHQEHCYG